MKQNPFIRLVTLLLILCLIADPALAQLRTQGSGSGECSPELFQAQALAEPPVCAAHQILSRIQLARVLIQVLHFVRGQTEKDRWFTEEFSLSNIPAELQGSVLDYIRFLFPKQNAKSSLAIVLQDAEKIFLHLVAGYLVSQKETRQSLSQKMASVYRDTQSGHPSGIGEMPDFNPARLIRDLVSRGNVLPKEIADLLQLILSHRQDGYQRIDQFNHALHVEMERYSLSASGGLIPAVSARMGRFFGGETSRIYRWFAGPVIEEFLGEYLHDGSGWRRAISYIPRGFGLVLLTAIIAHHFGLSLGFTLILTVLSSIGHRWRFVLAHPKRHRVIPVFISVINVIVPPLIAYHFHFSLMGFVYGAGAALLVHMLANVFAKQINRVWRAAQSWWYWSRANSPEGLRSAIDWSFQHDYIDAYEMPWQPEFLLPRIPAWEMYSARSAEAGEWLIAIIEVAVHLLGGVLFGATFLKILIEYLFKHGRRFLVKYMKKMGRSANQAMIDFESADPKERSLKENPNRHELAIEKLEGYFYNILRWKGGKITDERDVKILRLLEEKGLSYRDPFVVKAAIRAIGVVSSYLPEWAHLRLRKRYHVLLGDRSDLVRGSVARDLSQEFIDIENIHVITDALKQSRQTQPTQAYLAESLEIHLGKYPLRYPDDPVIFSTIQNLLIEKAENPHNIGPVRANSIRALAQLQGIEETVYQRLGELLLKDPNPNVREAASWALPRATSENLSQQLDDLSEKLQRFVQKHAGRPNPIQERFAKELLVRLAAVTHRTDVRQAAQAIELHAPVVARNPYLFLETDVFRPGEYVRKADLLRFLNRLDCTVLDLDNFRENRDIALHLEADPEHPSMSLRPDRFLAVLQKLEKNEPARTPVWDPQRGKSTARMEFVIEPLAGRRIIVIGKSHDIVLVDKALSQSIPVLHLSDLMSHGRIDYDALKENVLQTLPSPSLSSEDQVMPSAAPPLPEELSSLLRRPSGGATVPLEELKAQHSALFTGDARAQVGDLARLVHAFDPTVILSDVDRTLNMKTGTSLADTEYPDNQSSLYYLAANAVAGRRVTFISLNTREKLKHAVARSLEVLLGRHYDRIYRAIEFLHDAGSGGFTTDVHGRLMSHRSRRLPMTTRRAVSLTLVEAYFRNDLNLPGSREETLEALRVSFRRTSWTHASLDHPYHFDLPGGARLVDTGPQIGLMLPKEMPHLQDFRDAIAHSLREALDEKIRRELLYVSCGSEYVSANVTNKGLRVKTDLAKRLKAWRQSGHAGPLRVLVMGDSEADIPLLTLRMEGIEILPVYLGPLPQPGMASPPFPHARGAALVLAALLSPQAIEEILRLRFEAFPNAAYEAEIRPQFAAIIAALRAHEPQLEHDIPLAQRKAA